MHCARSGLNCPAIRSVLLLGCAQSAMQPREHQPPGARRAPLLNAARGEIVHGFKFTAGARAAHCHHRRRHGRHSGRDQLREAGYHDFIVYEKAGRLGGTWRENTYPGIACNVPAHLYTYTFEPNPHWSHVFV